jgi:hypothetical protein
LPADPATIGELLDRVQIEWAALQFVVGGLSESELTAPGPEEWSVKDHLGHIAEWERGCTAVLERRPQWEGFRLDEAAYTGLELDPLNDILYQRHRSDSVSEVKALRNAAHADIVAAVSHLADADLRRPVGEYGMGSNPDRLLLEKIAGDTYEHYAEHAGWIKALLDAR